MTRWLMALWWVLALVLVPIWLPLAIYTRRTAMRLPEAQGATEGEVAGAVAADRQPLRLLLVGESTVAGVGVAEHSQGLAAHCAQALALPQGVRWSVLGENGITAKQAVDRLLPRALVQPADCVVLVFGVNDSTHFSRLSTWHNAIVALAQPWLARGACVVVTAVPPLARFSALPWLLRRLLGWRAQLMDRDLRECAQQLGLQYCAPDLPFAAQYLAEDGYHPSALGYQQWGQNLAQQLRQHLVS